MRILQVVHQFLPKYSGGTEVYTADLMRRLRDRGHELALLTGGDRPENTTWEGIPVTVVPGGLRGPGGPGALFLATFGSWDAEDMFRKLARDFRPQVVHFQHLLGLSGKLPAFARKAKVPSVATLHDYWFVCPKSQLTDEHGAPCDGPHWGVNCVRCAAARLDSPLVAKAAPLLAPAFMLRQRTVRDAYRRVDRLLAPSDFLLQQALRAGLPAKKLQRVHFGRIPSPTAARSERPATAPLRVAYLGAIDPSKGVHVLLEACRSLDPQQVAVAVYGGVDAAAPDYAARVRALAAATPYGNSLLRGQLRHERVAGMLAETDVLVVPSLWYENAPMVIAEACAAGVPVVASNLGALAEHVADGVSGLLFPPGDAPALAAALQRLATEPDLVERLRAGIPTTLSRNEHVQEMEQVYSEVAGFA